jgi:hypothetical protein
MLIAGGAVLTIASIPLAWLKAGGTVLEATTPTGAEGGVLVFLLFLAAVAMLALMVVPYATRSGSFRLDRPVSYSVLLTVGVVALGAKIVELVGTGGSSSLAPGDAPGLWLAIAGMALAAWGVLELLAERPPPP